MPDFTDYVRRNLPPLGVPATREAEIVEELAIEVEERYQRALRCGLTAEQAWSEIENGAGSWRELAQELSASANEPAPSPEAPARTQGKLAAAFGDLSRDIRYAARQLRRSPGFTTVAVLMLALGIGANTAIFSLLNAVLLRHLPVHRPSELVFFGAAHAEGDTEFLPHGSTEAFSYPFYKDFLRQNQVFSDVAAIHSYLVSPYGRLPGQAGMQKLNVEMVSGTYFRTLGVDAVLGRAFTGADDRTPGAHPVAVVRYSWWRDHFPGDRSLAGKTITIGSTVYNVIGVAPPGFSGVTVGQAPDVWIPLAMQREIAADRAGLDKKWFQCLHIIARLKPGMGRERAQANTNLLFREILRGYLGPKPTAAELKDTQQAFIQLTPAATGRSRLRSQFTSPLLILMAVVMLVLLIACANVANLLLARAAARRREVAVRMAIGAERTRLIRQLLAESGLLAAVGAALGVAFAWSAGTLLVAMVSAGPEVLPIRVTPDAGVLAFTIAVTIATVLLFGAAPAFRATRLDVASSLKTRIAVASGGGGLARGLVAGQVALSLVLLWGAGLFLRSLAKLADVDVGFDRRNAVCMHVDPRAAGYDTDARLTALMEQVEQRVASVPGVRAAAFALSVFEGGGSSGTEVRVPGRPNDGKNPPTVFDVVGPEYLDGMKMPLLMGRGLSVRDNLASRKVAVINQTMALDFFPGGPPLGRTFSVGDDADWQNIEVIGVVKDAKYFELEEHQRPAAFFPYAQHPEHYLYDFVVRYAGDAAAVVPEIRTAIRGVDPNLPVSDVRTLAQLVDDFTLNRRLVADLSTFFGVLAALLASIGIYGVMSYGVARRTNEFGIRMALGAGRSQVIWVVLREILVLAAVGLTAGLALALALGSLVEGLLFGTEAANPAVIALAVAAMVGIALLAGYLPARRATRIDPSVALRWE